MNPSESFLSPAVPPASHFGLGMLRLDTENPSHRETVREAFQAGIEVVDLGLLVHSDFLSKVGVLAAAAREAPRFVPGSVRALVRGNLGEVSNALGVLAELPADVDALFDWVYLVADPEFALGRFEGDHAKLYAAIHADLDALETARDRGLISGYGIGSAGFTYTKEDPEFLAIEPLVRGHAGFRFVEFPFNLYESGAFLAKNQVVGSEGAEETVSLLEAGTRLELHTIARRPFDALTEHQLLRLVSYPDHHRLDLAVAVERTLEAALRFENGTPGRWAHRLRTNLRHVRDPEQWKEILRRKIEPDLAPLRVNSEYTDYVTAMDALLLAVRLWCEKFGAERNERIRSRLVEVAPSLRNIRDFPTLLAQLYRSVPGLHTVLAGTRSAAQLRNLLATSSTSTELSIETTAALLETGYRVIHDVMMEDANDGGHVSGTAALEPHPDSPKGLA